MMNKKGKSPMTYQQEKKTIIERAKKRKHPPHMSNTKAK